MFEPFEVPDSDTGAPDAHRRASASSKDELTLEVPVRPWGVQAYASASGTSSDDAMVFVGLPTGRTYETRR